MVSIFSCNYWQESKEVYFPQCQIYFFDKIQNCPVIFGCKWNIYAKKSICHCMNTPIYDIYHVKSIAFWTKMLFFAFWFHVFAPQLQKPQETAVLVASHTPQKSKLRSMCRWCFWCSFGSRWRVKLRTGFEECSKWKRTSQVKEDNYVWVHACVCVVACTAVCLPSLYVHRIYGNPSLWPSCFWLQIFLFLSLFRMTTRKLLHLRLQVVFLTWSFLSRIVINIYTFIFQCNKDAIM